MFCISVASVDGIFYFSPPFCLHSLFQNNATVIFVVLAPYSTPIAHRMASQWNSQPGMTRNLSISLWFGSYITSYFAWHTCLPNPVTDWKSLISTDRLHLVLCINMCLNLPKAWLLCCIPGTVSALKSVWHPAESLPQPHCLLRALRCSWACVLPAQRWAKCDKRKRVWADAGHTSGAGEKLGTRTKGYGTSGENVNKGKRPLAKIFNLTSLKAKMKLC